MQAKTLIATAREDYLDDTNPDKYLWSDASLLRKCSEAERQACNRANLLYDNSTRQYKTLKMDITHVNIIEFLFGLLSLIGGLMVGTVIWIIKDFHTRINTSEEKANGLYSAYLIAHGKLEERVKECEVFVDGIQKSYLVLRRD